MARRVNHRLIKIHRSYTVEELAALVRCHKQTVRLWLCRGLSALNDQKKPMLIHGAAAREFLERRQRAAKHKCGAGEMYCFKCKRPQEPACGMADFRPTSTTGGVLSGLCYACATLMFKRTSIGSLDQLPAGFDVKFVGADGCLVESAPPFSNCHLQQKG